MRTVETLEAYFSPYRANIIGNSQVFDSPFGKQRMVYADWTASGRAYQPIESFIQKEVLPFAGNTHTGSTITGTLMSSAYEKAKTVIKQHINAGADDALLFCGSGMTSAVNKLQRLLGLKIAGRLKDYGYNPVSLDEDLRPVVFVSHMEHHSNHTSWLETIATVEVIPPSKEGNIDLEYFAALLERYKHRKNKIAAITACSNVTGIETPYHEVARLIHRYGGLCFVDFACSAPYVAINMHPQERDAQLDAIYFSMHKFLGGPGTPGVLVFDKSLYKNQVPDQPGGGTVTYSNPWGGRRYINDIESREDGGTPPFLQAIKAAMCIRLKERMGIENIRMREAEIVGMILNRLALMKNVEVLAPNNRDRLGVVSFTVAGAHYNLIVKLLNDRFGIQMRGGCSCAGTYGHYLLEVDEEWSEQVLNAIIAGDTSQKPGWVRLSVHAIMPDDEITFILDAIEATATHFSEWAEDYRYDSKTNEFIFKGSASGPLLKGDEWFDSWRWDKVIPQAINLDNHENATLVSAVD